MKIARPSRLILLGVLSLSILVLAQACSSRTSPLAPLPLTSEQRLADFNFLCETLKSSYPYFGISKRITGYDWQAHIPEFQAQVTSASGDEEFAEIVARSLRLLNNGHIGIMSSQSTSVLKTYALIMKSWKDQIDKTTPGRADYWFSFTGDPSDVRFPTVPFYAVYAGGQYVVADVAEEDDLASRVPLGSTVVSIDGIPVHDYVRRGLGTIRLKYDPGAKLLFQPALTYLVSPENAMNADRSVRRLAVTLKTRDGRVIDAEVPVYVPPWNPSYSWPPAYVSNGSARRSPSGNLYVTMLGGQVVYVQVLSMLSGSNDIAYDMKTLREFLQSRGDINAIIVDIRGNGGGSDTYWQTLVAMLANGPVSSPCGVAWRDSEFVKPFMQDKNVDALPAAPQSDLLSAQSSGQGTFPPEILTGEFVAPKAWTRTVDPDNSLNYQGKVFLLVDGYVFSSAESFAAFCKGSKWATVVGSYTGGDGIGFDPLIVTLPNSGMIVRFPGDMGLNPDWSANEEFHTSPDIRVEWTPDEILQYAATKGQPERPDPASDPLLRACMEQVQAGVEEPSF